MQCPGDLFYTETHEWVRKVTEDEAVVGITTHAQEQLGDVVFVELPEINRNVKAKEACAVIESVKAAYDTYAPVSGIITMVNKRLEASPQLVNEDPYGEGWFFQIRMNDPKELNQLLRSEDYEKMILKA